MQFTGKERDSETGLDYFGARYLSGAQGRFTSPDPAMSSAKLDDPQTWNRYAYVTNNPLRYIDSDGRDRREAAQDGRVGGDPRVPLPSSNRTCGFPASGSPEESRLRHAQAACRAVY